ncbi:MAG: DUF192 domain-containing protein [Patescibacteria group bacterium]
MKKDLAIIGGLFVVIIVLVIFGQGFTSGGFLSSSGTSGSATKSAVLSGQIPVAVKSLNASATVATTPDQRKKGLANLDSLPLNSAMLFVFDHKDSYAIWMKDMRFAIDIIWIDENKKIVDIAQNVAPEPKKKDRELTVYRPKADAKYVLEVNAGLASLNGLVLGDPVQF